LLRNQTLASQMQDGFRDTNHVPRPGQQGPESGNSLYNYNNRMTIGLSRSPVRVEQTPPAQTPEP
jgi:hypothetical protein